MIGMITVTILDLRQNEAGAEVSFDCDEHEQSGEDAVQPSTPVLQYHNVPSSIP